MQRSEKINASTNHSYIGFPRFYFGPWIHQSRYIIPRSSIWQKDFLLCLGFVGFGIWPLRPKRFFTVLYLVVKWKLISFINPLFSLLVHLLFFLPSTYVFKSSVNYSFPGTQYRPVIGSQMDFPHLRIHLLVSVQPSPKSRIIFFLSLESTHVGKRCLCEGKSEVRCRKTVSRWNPSKRPHHIFRVLGLDSWSSGCFTSLIKGWNTGESSPFGRK